MIGLDEIRAITHATVGWWHRRQRQIDMDVLWPTCVRLAKSIDHARAAFALHVALDPSWRSIGDDELRDFIAGLEPDSDRAP